MSALPCSRPARLRSCAAAASPTRFARSKDSNTSGPLAEVTHSPVSNSYTAALSAALSFHGGTGLRCADYNTTTREEMMGWSCCYTVIMPCLAPFVALLLFTVDLAIAGVDDSAPSSTYPNVDNHCSNAQRAGYDWSRARPWHLHIVWQQCLCGFHLCDTARRWAIKASTATQIHCCRAGRPPEDPGRLDYGNVDRPPLRLIVGGCRCGGPLRYA